MKKVGKLILIRHAESEWNAKGIWTGLADVCLSEKGKRDCTIVGEAIRGLHIPIDVAIYSNLRRTSETLSGVCEVLGADPDKVCLSGFDERSYGEFTGMNKWKVKDEVGEEKFNEIRRGWDVPISNGETLKDVYERMLPDYEQIILPLLRQGKNVLVVAHGNSLRALIKHLESIPEDKVADIKMPMSQIMVYDIDPETGLSQHKVTIESGVEVTAEF